MILVVDDEEDIREPVADMLRGEGYAVWTACNGKDALSQLDKMPGIPCLVLLDMMMPEMDGAELLCVLAETRRLAALPVVVVSGQPERANGARRAMRKPVSLDLLLAVVHEFCGEPRAAAPSPDPIACRPTLDGTAAAT